MILHVISNFSAPNGAEKMLIRLLNHCTQEPATVVSIVGITNAMRDLVTNPSIQFECLNARSPIAVLKAVPKLNQLIANKQPTAVMCWMYHAMFLGAVCARTSSTHVPVYWNVRQSLDDPTSFTRNTRLAVKLCKLFSGSPRATIYNSQRALNLHRQFGFRDAKSVVVPNGFELPKDVTIERGHVKTFGIAGRLHPQKDFQTFFQGAGLAARNNKDIRFVVAGKGNTADNPEIMSMLADNDLLPEQVELCGPVKDMAAFYRKIDMLVLSSRTEGFPNVVAEAMSYGKPVITTDVGDAATIVADSGIVVPSKDAQALCKAIEQATEFSPDEYFHRSKMARDRIASVYSISSIADRYRAVLGTELQ